MLTYPDVQIKATGSKTSIFSSADTSDVLVQNKGSRPITFTTSETPANGQGFVLKFGEHFTFKSITALYAFVDGTSVVSLSY